MVHDGVQPFYWNLWVLGFDEANRCAEYVEWYMTQPSEETGVAPYLSGGEN